jgi:hypothetical protein
MLDSMTTPPPATPKRLSKWKYVVGVILLVLVARGIGSFFGRLSGEERAKESVDTDAKALGAPSGMFGAKWLMTSKEVRSAIPAAVESAPDQLVETRQVYGRAAQVQYHFKDDRLLLVLVQFVAPSSESQFDQIELQLAASYKKSDRS